MAPIPNAPQALVNIPNLITIGRLLLVPLTVWLMLNGEFQLAFASFVAASVSDGVDGYLARRFGWQTELGAYLDPLADKALLVSIYVVLGVLLVIPTWLVFTVVTRDILIIGGVMLAWLMDKPLEMNPLMVSKVNTTAQFIFASIILGLLAFEIEHLMFLEIGGFVVASLTIVSGAYYMRNWLNHMNKTETGDT